MEVIAWKVWYVGGASYCSTGYAWEDLPNDGVLGVKVFFDEHSAGGVQLSRVMSGRDWFWRSPALDGKDIYGCNDDELEENKVRYPNGSWKRGKWTSDQEAHDVIDKMTCWTI